MAASVGSRISSGRASVVLSSGGQTMSRGGTGLVDNLFGEAGKLFSKEGLFGAGPPNHKSDPHSEDIVEDTEPAEPEKPSEMHQSISLRLKNSAVVKEAHPVLDSNWFNLIVTLAIMFNTIQIGLSADLREPPWTDVWAVTEFIFNSIFFIEMVIKLYFLRFTYFKSRWNLLDFFLVGLATLEFWLNLIIASTGKSTADLGKFTFLRVVRLMRVFRILRIVKLFKDLVLLVDSVVSSMLTLGWLLILLAFMLYIYAVALVELVGTDKTFPAYNDDPEVLNHAFDDFNNYQFFGTVLRAMNSLFSLITLSEWSLICRPIAEQRPAVMIIMVMFTMTTTFGIMNVVIGVMVEHALEASQKMNKAHDQDEKEKQMFIVSRITTIIADIDDSGDQELQLDELNSALEEHPDLMDMVGMIDLPESCTLTDLFTLIDEEGDGSISAKEFESAMHRMLFCTDFHRMVLMQISFNKLRLVLNASGKTQANMGEDILALRKDIAQEFRSVHQAINNLGGTGAVQQGAKTSPQERFVPNLLVAEVLSVEEMLNAQKKPGSLPQSPVKTPNGATTGFEGQVGFSLCNEFEELRRKLNGEALVFLGRIVDEARDQAIGRAVSSGLGAQIVGHYQVNGVDRPRSPSVDRHFVPYTTGATPQKVDAFRGDKGPTPMSPCYAAVERPSILQLLTTKVDELEGRADGAVVFNERSLSRSREPTNA